MNHQAESPSHFRRIIGFTTLGVLLVLAVVALTQCRSIEEPLGGAQITPQGTNARSECVQECNEQFHKGRAHAAAEYHEASAECGHKKNCRKKAAKSFKEDLEKLVRQMHECKKKCYNEGAGFGGR